MWRSGQRTGSSSIIGKKSIVFFTFLVLSGRSFLDLNDLAATTTLTVRDNILSTDKERTSAVENVLLRELVQDNNNSSSADVVAAVRASREENAPSSDDERAVILHNNTEDKAPIVITRSNISSTDQGEPDTKANEDEKPLQSYRDTMHADKFDKLYHILHNVCVQAKNNDNFVLSMERASANQTTFNYTVFRGGYPGLTDLTFRVVPSDANANETYQAGTTMLTSHHTPDNNFHLQNDFLLPVFRANSFFNITRLLLLRGCITCWNTRLPLMQQVLNMMNLRVNDGTLLYPAQDVLGSNKRRQCYERLIIEKPENGKPYYTHPGRFSPCWPQSLFFSYRDHLSAHVKTFKITSIGVEETNHSKPVLTWMSRGHLNPRQITNAPEVIEELSKYFSVHVIDFSSRNRRTTVEQSMAYVAETNVLIGPHGAGLGYTALLPNNSMLVELKNSFGSEKKMFLNMASQLDIPYYAAHLNLPNETKKNIVRSIPQFARQIYDAWVYHDVQEERHMNYTGECLFPRHVQPHGWLSNSSVSRCYLEQRKATNVWSQCVAFGECG